MKTGGSCPLNSIALKRTKIVYNSGLTECSRVKCVLIHL